MLHGAFQVNFTVGGPPSAWFEEKNIRREAPPLAAQTASLNPPTLEELIPRELKIFERRGQRSFYRSMLRSAVQNVDVVRPKRSFSDSEAWKMALRQLQSDGSLLYNEGDDTVSLLPQPS